MKFYENEWYGFKRLDFEFEGRKAILVCPDEPCEGKKWLYKTEYFEAFPTFKIRNSNFYGLR